MKPLPGDLGALASGGKAALARCLSALETDPDDRVLLALLEAAWCAPKGVAVGLTGPPGVGKSTLAHALIPQLRRRGETVAVIAVDPSSRQSGGALLGDRIRIATDPEDNGVFVRSMAARRRLGGLAEPTFPAVVLMRALFDWVLIETVGVGQSETEIADCADLVALCLQPEAGDAVQFMKAGVMEVPDLVVVTKGDFGASARRAAADIRGAISLSARGGQPVEVALVSSLTGEGIAEVVGLMAARREKLSRVTLRRREQGRAWIAARLYDSFGRVGHAALAVRTDASENPFAALSAIGEPARQAVYQGLKNI